MPSEIRYINFTTDEFVDAARLYFRRVGEKLPGEIVSAAFEHDCCVRLGLQHGNGRTSERTLDHGKVGSVLIFYCISNKIPLPANSIRTLKVVGGNLCLMVTKNIPTASLGKIKLDIPD